MEIKLKDNNDDLIITRGGVSVKVFDFLSKLPPPVEGDVQIFADPECTKYATGVVDTVYVRVNTPWRFGKGWDVQGPSNGDFFSAGFSDDPVEFWITAYVDFTSELSDRSYTAGQVVECSLDLQHVDPVDVTNYQKVFTKP